VVTSGSKMPNEKQAVRSPLWLKVVNGVIAFFIVESIYTTAFGPDALFGLPGTSALMVVPKDTDVGLRQAILSSAWCLIPIIAVFALSFLTLWIIRKFGGGDAAVKSEIKFPGVSIAIHAGGMLASFFAIAIFVFGALYAIHRYFQGSQ
jgi:hypothetical protein